MGQLQVKSKLAEMRRQLHTAWKTNSCVQEPWSVFRLSTPKSIECGFDLVHPLIGSIRSFLKMIDYLLSELIEHVSVLFPRIWALYSRWYSDFLLWYARSFLRKASIDQATLRMAWILNRTWALLQSAYRRSPLTTLICLLWHAQGRCVPTYA